MNLVAAQLECRRICRASGSNFLTSFPFLTSQRRKALEAFYAFCSSVDAAVDDAPSEAVARKNIAAWRDELDRMVKGSPHFPIGIALAHWMQVYAIPANELGEIIAGCEMDLTQREYADFPALELYCYRVASCVGRVCLPIFGISSSAENLQIADNLGKALQLTNIVRDIGEDLRRGRLYLPLEDLQKFGVTRTDLATRENRENISRLLTMELDRAVDFYRRAFTALPRERALRRRWIAPLIIGRTYFRLYEKLRDNPLAGLSQRTRLSTWEKIATLLGTARELYL